MNSESQHGGSFPLQLFQRSLEETLASFQKSIHEDMRNLHIEILRQFHMLEVGFSINFLHGLHLAVCLLGILITMQMEMSSGMRLVLENQAEVMKELKSLRKETQELRQAL